MKIRDSGMPDESVWRAFFDPRRVLALLSFQATSVDVADFGCGYGTFTIAAAAQTSGIVHAFDIDPAMVAATRRRTRGLANVEVMRRDLLTDGTGLPEASVGYAMLFNVLHGDDPVRLLREARRVLTPGGTVAVIHWIHDAATPRGPSLGIRPRPEQCEAWIEEAGFVISQRETALPPYHFGIVGVR